MTHVSRDQKAVREHSIVAHVFVVLQLHYALYKRGKQIGFGAMVGDRANLFIIEQNDTTNVGFFFSVGCLNRLAKSLNGAETPEQVRQRINAQQLIRTTS